jgi:hypothetical protein
MQRRVRTVSVGAKKWTLLMDRRRTFQKHLKGVQDQSIGMMTKCRLMKKKRLFSDDEDEDLEGAKRQKCAVDEEVRMPEPTLNVGLSEQSCEKQ